VFPAYDANQLGDILNRRRDAYHDGVLSDDVIPLCSAFSAQEHGDARRAIDLFRLAGGSLATTMPTTSAKNTSALPTMMPK